MFIAHSCLLLENSGFFFNFNQPHKWSGILKCFSLQKGVFSSRINEWTRSWIPPLQLLTIRHRCARRLECGRLVSIRWLENLDHMALARGKTKNEATVCDGLIPCVTLMCDPASSSGASFFARFRKEASAQREWLVLFLLGYLGYHGFTYFGFSVPSIFLADLLGNTCLLARVQKVMVCDSWLMDFDPLLFFSCPNVRCFVIVLFRVISSTS